MLSNDLVLILIKLSIYTYSLHMTSIFIYMCKRYIHIESIIKTCSSLGKKIVIDCGHTLIFNKDKSYSFGKTGTPSQGEIESFRYGVKIFNLLQDLNKRMNRHGFNRHLRVI